MRHEIFTRFPKPTEYSKIGRVIGTTNEISKTYGLKLGIPSKVSLILFTNCSHRNTYN